MRATFLPKLSCQLAYHVSIYFLQLVITNEKERMHNCYTRQLLLLSAPLSSHHPLFPFRCLANRYVICSILSLQPYLHLTRSPVCCIPSQPVILSNSFISLTTEYLYTFLYCVIPWQSLLVLFALSRRCTKQLCLSTSAVFSQSSGKFSLRPRACILNSSLNSTPAFFLHKLPPWNLWLCHHSALLLDFQSHPTDYHPVQLSYHLTTTLQSPVCLYSPNYTFITKTGP